MSEANLRKKMKESPYVKPTLNTLRKQTLAGNAKDVLIQKFVKAKVGKSRQTILNKPKERDNFKLIFSSTNMVDP